MFVSQPPNLSVIRTKKQELLNSAVRYETLAAEARAEAAEYEAAERVWLKHFGTNGDVHHSADDIVKTLNEMSDVERVSSGIGNAVEIRRKPAGVPPVPQMILEALQLAEVQGKRGLIPHEMVDFVRRKYWPEAGSPDIGSTAWRMWKDGRLAKPDENSSLYTIARDKEDAA